MTTGASRNKPLGFGRATRIVWLLFVVAAASAPMSGARALMPDSEIVQLALTEGQVKNYISAQRELSGVIFRVPDDRSDVPDATSRAQMESILRRNGFSAIEDYDIVARNVALVMEGVDPRTKTYVGASEVLQRQLAQIESDPSATMDEKQTAKAEIEAQSRTIAPIRFPANIDLVMRNLDAILAASPFGGPAFQD